MHIDDNFISQAGRKAESIWRRKAIAQGYPNGIGLQESVAFSAMRPYRTRQPQWWRVGTIVDLHQEYELAVWLRPDTGEVRLETPADIQRRATAPDPAATSPRDPQSGVADPR